MFHSARVKLTLWYVVISMAVSVFFSGVIFASIHHELQRNERKLLVEMQLRRDIHPQSNPMFVMRKNMLDYTERAIALRLLYVDLIILVLSLFAGYFLAGRTLRPIQEMVDAQNQFAADASHELRTPLTALKTAIEVNLRDKKMDVKQAKTVLAENLADVNNLQRLSENLLALASFKTNGVHINDPVNVPEVLKKAIQIVSYQAKEKSITIDQNLEKTEIFGDPKRLTDTFVIFLDNAIKYSPEKTTVAVTAKKEERHVAVTIKDEGIGIAKKDSQRVFERFYRADTSRSKSNTPGYGLGLAIAKEIIEAHGGTVHVRSNVGHGTTFTITLPITKMS